MTSTTLLRRFLMSACSVIMPDNATKVCEFLSSWKILSVYFERRGVFGHSASSLMSSFGWSSGLHVVQTGWDGWFSLACADQCVRSSAKSRSSRVKKRIHLMPSSRSDVVCCITHSIVRLKSNADIGHASLRPSKKKHVSHPRPLHILAPPLFFHYFLWAPFLWAKTNRRHL